MPSLPFFFIFISIFIILYLGLAEDGEKTYMIHQTHH